MALKDVNERTLTAITKALPNEGDKLEGYITKLVDGKYGTDFLFQTVGGQTMQLGLVQHIRYMINDGKISEGIYTVITRLPDEKVKGKLATRFRVQQDDERTMGDAAFDAIGTEPTKADAPNLTNGAKAALDKASVRERAEQLKKSAVGASK